MRKKGFSSDLITREILEETLDVRLNDFSNDIKRDLAVFKKEITGDIDQKITAAMSKLYSRIDPLLSEVENAREDREFTTDKLENHEKRIKKLERN